MAHFSERSKSRLATCDPDLQRLFNRVIEVGKLDIVIVCGARSKEAQDAAVAGGVSKAPWPTSKHNCPEPGQLSRAVDWAPWVDGGIPWKATDQFLYIAGILAGLAEGMGISIRNGADWRRNARAKGNAFEDLGHTEKYDRGV